MGNYLDYISGRESGGDYTAANPKSSAGGKYQFIDDTWLSVVRRARPDLANMPDKKLIALKTSNSELGRELQDQAANYHLKADVVPLLQKNGIEPDQKSIYLSWFAGPQGAINIMKSDPNTPISKVLGKDAIAANASVKLGDKQFKDFTTSDIQEWAARNKSAPAAPSDAPRTAIGTLSDEALMQGPPAPSLSTEEVLTAMEPRRENSGLRELGFLHNYFKSLDVTATGMKPLNVPDFFHQQPRYKDGGIVSLKKDAERVRSAGIGGDTILAHINPEEVALLKSMGGSGRINPRTGLPMFDEGESRGDPEGGSSSPEGPSTGESPGPGGGGMRDSNTTDSTGTTGGNAGTGTGTGTGAGGGLGDKGEQGDKEGASRGSVQDTAEAVSPSTSTPANSPELSTVNDFTSSFTNTPDKTPSFDLATAINNAVNTAVNTAPAFSAISASINPTVSATNPNSTKSQAFDLSGPNMSTSPAPGTVQGTATSTGLANTSSIAGMGLSTIGGIASPSTATQTAGVSPSTSTSTPSSSTPTANSSTTKGPGYDITGIGLIDKAITSAMNNPVSAATNAAFGVLGGPAGVANSISGLLGGPTIGGAVSSAFGTGSGYGNTSKSSSDTEAPSSNPSGPGASVGDMSGGTSGGGAESSNLVNPSTTASSSSPTKTVSYDVSKFLGSLGKPEAVSAPSVYSAYPVQQGIGSIAAPNYTGSFYNPTFGQVPYYRS